MSEQSEQLATNDGTYMFDTIDRKKKHNENELKYALLARELVVNGYQHGAKNIIIANITVNKTNYVMIAHNGKEFGTKEHLKRCLRPSNSYGNTGIQGNGMKAAMFLSINTISPSTDAEMIVCSKNTDKTEDFALKLSCEKLNNALITDVTDEISFKKILGEYYDDYNVLTLVKTSLFSSMDRNKEKFFTFETARLLVESCPEICNKLEIRSSFGIYNESINDKEKMRKIHTSQEFDDNFCNDQETFHLNDISYEYEAGKTVNFDAEITLKVYPGLFNGHNRLVKLNPNNHEYGRTTDVDAISNQNLFVSLDLKLDSDKDTSRISTDSYYISSRNKDNMNILGLGYNHNLSFNSKIKDHWQHLIDHIEDKEYNIEYWQPKIKAFIKLKPKSQNFNEIYNFGGLDEFFYCNDKTLVRNLVRKTYETLQEMNPKALIEFKARVKKNHFPTDDNQEFIPLPVDDLTSKNILIAVLKDGAKIYNFQPGQIIRNCQLCFLEHSLDENDVAQDKILPFDDSVLECTGGFKIEPNGPNFDVSILPLSRKNDDGSVSEVEKEEYEHTTSFLPKKYLVCRTNTGRYRISGIVKIPIRNKIAGKGINDAKAKDRISSKLTYDNYIELAPEFYGQIEEGVLRVNKNNVIIKTLATVNKEQFPNLADRWQRLYQDSARLAEVVKANLSNLDIDFKRKVKDGFINRDIDVELYYLNTHLDIFFKSDRVTNLLNDIERFTNK